ncbi:MAG: hypothetical protein F6J93_17655 [Oscillatoria sp. SIO1A7]|nr:hypothetical protein [Oscillatoria sp. SIO1A7]
MNTVDKNKLQTFLEDLKSADLVGMSFQANPLRLRLEFTFGSEYDDVAIELYHLVHFSFSQPLNLEEIDPCFWVGKVEIKKIENSEDSFLSTLPYPLQNLDSQNDMESSPLLHLHLEGDIAIDVLHRRYQLFREFKAELVQS